MTMITKVMTIMKSRKTQSHDTEKQQLEQSVTKEEPVTSNPEKEKNRDHPH